MDSLENALDFPPGLLWTSHLPGYAAETDADSLRGALAGTSVVIALVSDASTKEPQFNFELGAAWLLGIHIVFLILGEADNFHVPAVLHDAPVVRGQQHAQWNELIADLARRLGVAPRVASQRGLSLAPASSHAQSESVETQDAPAIAASEPLAPVDESVAEAIREALAAASHPVEPREQTQRFASYAPPFQGLPPVDDIPEPLDLERVASDTFNHERAPSAFHAHSAAFEFDDAESDAFPFDHSAGDAVPVSDDELLEVTATNHGVVMPTPQPDRTLVSDVFPRLPSCELALEAGRAVSECVFNRAEIGDFGAELSGSFGRFITALGASWDNLRADPDLDRWLVIADQLLQDLPTRASKVEDWYKLGFELATLHNLAGQLALDGSDALAEQRWREALERFLVRAERAEIGYENLGRVLGLLENLAGPSHERDLANIGRSLEELRRHAIGADAIHTAA